MGGLRRATDGKLRKLLSAGVAVTALAAALPHAGLAQSVGTNAFETAIPANAKLLLSSRNLVYNDRIHTVVASGAVRIAYGAYRLVAKRVEYNQDTGRMKASGEVELVTPDGTRTYADTMDVTDNFADGFVNALRVDTTDDTHIVAESAERRGGVETQFNNGVYTACEPCKENPDKAPFWAVKARRVVHDSQSKTIRMHDAEFDMFGIPLAYFPYFSVPDQSVKRKSGFLRPIFGYKSTLGASVSQPYYQVISPSVDATLSVTGYSSQGFMAQGEFRQRFHNGFHTLTIAGIDQASPDSFDAITEDSRQRGRAMIGSKAEFAINTRWKAGWDVLLQSDANFARTYSIEGFTNSTQVSQIYLTGLNDRNYLDIRGYHFDEQPADNYRASDYRTLERQQPFVLPVIDYTYIPDEPVLGGQLTFTANETSIYRDLQDSDVNANGNTRIHGVAGTDHRLTGELEWKRTLKTPGGLLLTPLLAARGDVFGVDASNAGSVSLADPSFAGNGTHARTMETAGLEARYPILVSAAHSSHVIEPIAQVFARPDEPLTGGLPNEDAQSFVFDTTNLFSRDKFSGFDRVEGGTRANIGVRYSGTFDSGFTLQGVFGQSYQLAGKNSFASPDLVYAGHDSGLENSVSDYVGSLGVNLPGGFNFLGQARFDRSDFSIQRTGIQGGYTNNRLAAYVVYSELAPQPDYGSNETLREVSTNATVRLDQSWRVFGNVTYNLEKSAISRDAFGVGFNNSCFALDLVYWQKRNIEDPSATAGSDWAIGARLSFRTLGDVNLGSTSAASWPN